MLLAGEKDFYVHLMYSHASYLLVDENVLDTRQEKGFGDCVAILTQSSFNQDGTTDPWCLKLYIYQGRSRFYGEYVIRESAGEGEKLHNEAPIVPALTGWPLPDVDEVLQCLASPFLINRFFVTDGERAWGGSPYDRFQKPGEFDPDTWAAWERLDPAVLYRYIWPGRNQLFGGYLEGGGKASVN